MQIDDEPETKNPCMNCTAYQRQNQVQAQSQEFKLTISIGAFEDGQALQQNPTPTRHDRLLAAIKDEMPPVCGEQLEWVARHWDLHTSRLLLACKSNALRPRNGVLVTERGLLVHVFGGFAMLFFMGFAGLSLSVWLPLFSNLSLTSHVQIAFLSAVSAVGIAFVHRNFFIAHSAAKMAVESLARRSAT